jgi:DNA repair protein RadC
MEAQQMHVNRYTKLKNRFLEHGIETLESYEILEFLLFYAKPRKNASDLAYKLIDTFGSLPAVLEAPFDTLMQIEGMNSFCAILLEIVPAIIRVYKRERLSKNQGPVNQAYMGEMFLSKLSGQKSEQVAVALLSVRMQLISCKVVSKGALISAPVYIPQLVRMALLHNTPNVIIAHNHLICMHLVKNVVVSICPVQNLVITGFYRHQ